MPFSTFTTLPLSSDREDPGYTFRKHAGLWFADHYLRRCSYLSNCLDTWSLSNVELTQPFP